jgi:hypothetical protein
MCKFGLGPIKLKTNNVGNIFRMREGVIHGSVMVNSKHPVKIIALPDYTGLYLVEYISEHNQIVRLGFKEKDLYPVESKKKFKKKSNKKSKKKITTDFFYNGNPLTLINK